MKLLQAVSARVIIILVAVLACGIANAQIERFIAGTHYDVVPAAPALQDLQRIGERPSVNEVFWYGCPHCYAFDPLLDAWVAKQGAAINFTRSPMISNGTTAQHAHIFFAAQALGLGEQLHKPIFAAIQQQHNRLADESSAQKFFVDNGVPADKFAAAWKSFSMDATLRKHEAAMLALRVPSVPSMLVNGKYLVYVSDAVSTHEKMLEVVEFLLHKKG